MPVRPTTVSLPALPDRSLSPGPCDPRSEGYWHYLYQKKPLAKEEINVASATWELGAKKIVCDVENRGFGLVRVHEVATGREDTPPRNRK
jgi:hypothetical protein